jgi:hypothetical protein
MLAATGGGADVGLGGWFQWSGSFRPRMSGIDAVDGSSTGT